MKGLTKSIVALTLVITVLATMGMSAMAASYSTKTTYLAGDKVSVVANATEVTPGAIVTYVATTDANDVNEGTIVYINQAEADEDGKAEFSYTTSVTNINAAMFFGGSTEDTRVAAEHADDYVITVAINGVAAETKTYAAQQAVDAGPVIRKFDLTDIASLAGVKVTGVEFNNTAIEDFCADATTLMVSTELINADGVLNILTAEDAEFVAPKISETTAKDGENLVAVAKAVSGDKFGIVLYKGEKPAITSNEVVTTADYVVLPALGKNVAGIYAVELQGFAEFLKAPFNVAAYAYNKTADAYEISEKAVAIAE